MPGATEFDYLTGGDAAASARFEAGFALLAKHQLSFDLQCVPRQLEAAEEVRTSSALYASNVARCLAVGRAALIRAAGPSLHKLVCRRGGAAPAAQRI